VKAPPVNRTRQGFIVAVTALVSVLGGAPGCGAPPEDDPIKIGLLLSYTGFLAANSINSERSLLMAIEAANQAGGIDRRPVRVVARDTRSDPRRVAEPTRELLEAKTAVLIGPDSTDLISQLRELLQARTLLLPSYATASDVEWKPPSWFVMGAGLVRVACELVTQYRSDGRQSALQIVNPSGYTSSLSWELSNHYGLPKVVVSSDDASTAETVRPLQRALANADAYLLAAPPETASALVYALAAVGALDDPRRWFLSPTLHTPAFLDSIPKGILSGARGVSSGTVAGAAEFRRQFTDRWQDSPLDDAYPFYDAGAIAVLSIQRALREEGAIPVGNGLAKHLIAVTRAGGTPVRWNELGKGLEMLRQGEEIEYFGLTGQLQFDESGQTQTANTKWWTITDQGFQDVPHGSDCN
jgi:ABC-type branched-subunit amino acid transport system substrate-binding protein